MQKMRVASVAELVQLMERIVTQASRSAPGSSEIVGADRIGLRSNLRRRGFRVKARSMIFHPVIAIVDDEEPVRKALERLLRSSEMEAHVLASGRASWRQSRS